MNELDIAHAVAWYAFSFVMVSLGISMLYNGLIHDHAPIDIQIKKTEEPKKVEVIG